MTSENIFYDPVLIEQLTEVKKRVLKKDMDFRGLIDGRVGSGKSVLAMQICKFLDPTFNINDIVWTGQDFISLIRGSNLPKGKAIMLDETYSAAGSRAAMSDINKAVISLMTEVRQKNLFTFFVIPSIFDLDRALATRYSDALFHVYFGEEYKRGQFVLFDFETKNHLYRIGKKTDSYAYPYSPFPPMSFNGQYIVDEANYRQKKAEAFSKRPITNKEIRHMTQRDALIKALYSKYNLTGQQIADIIKELGGYPLTQQEISLILNKKIKISLEKADFTSLQAPEYIINPIQIDKMKGGAQ